MIFLPTERTPLTAITLARVLGAHYIESSKSTLQMEEASVNTKESEKDGTKQSKEEEQVTGRKRRRERRLKTQPKNVTGSGAPDTTGPRGICVSDFIQARAMEVYNMTAAIAQHGSARRTFQTLPRHMRRRSMSHNIKRLPHRLREQAKNEVIIHCTFVSIIHYRRIRVVTARVPSNVHN